MAKQFVGNSETGVVHKKHVGGRCRVAEIKTENRENFDTLEAALNLKRGKRKVYRACKFCCK